MTADYAELLRQARLKANLSQAELARLSGIPQPKLSRYEAGRQEPRLETLRRLLRACGTDLDIAARKRKS